MIEDVEKLRAETNSQSLGYVKLALQSDVRLPRAKSSQHVTSEVALRSRRRGSKSGAIEDLASGKLCALDLEWNTRNYVWPRSELRARREEDCANNIQGRS